MRRALRFRAARDPRIDPTTAADPRVVGAILEIVGSNPGDGAAGPLVLDPAFWVGVGRPRGSKGYKWLDRNVPNGIKRASFRSGSRGGSLVLSGGGINWPYQITQPQGPITVRFTIGAEVYCATFSTFEVNQAGKVVGRGAPPPVACTPSFCGNGLAEGGEECDDGNLANGDGCDTDCELENTSVVCAGVPSVSGTAIKSLRVASGLENPLAIAAPPLDPSRTFVVEQPGRIRLLKNGVLLPLPFLGIADKVDFGGERGLLGLAFHPDYENNGFFFVNYTRAPDGATVIARYSVSANPDVADASSEEVLYAIAQPFANHNGGDVKFGPDGFLYVGMGDGGSANDPLEHGQSDTTPLGKLLRIDVGMPPASVLDTVWAKGLRNPFRMSFDRLTGDLYIADVGQSAWEEVNVDFAPISAGANYGWDVYEGRHCFEPAPLFSADDCSDVPPGFSVSPVLEYDHGQGCAVTGGFVYRGCRMPDLAGTYFFSDFCSAFIRTFDGVVGGDAQNVQDRTADLQPGGGLSIDMVTGFGEDARGELYIADFGPLPGAPGSGEVYKIVPGP